MLWDLNDGKHLYSLEAGDVVNALVFSPNRYWLCAATASGIKIFDLESKSIVDDLHPEVADDDVVAVLELEAFAGELDPLAAAVDGLVGGDTEVRVEMDGARDLEDDPERLLDAARLAESPANSKPNLAGR